MLEVDGIYCCDAREGIAKLDDESIDCAMTSPPYWSLRDYRVPTTKWDDGEECRLGHERECDSYIHHLVGIFRQTRRVLKTGGTLWVNLGDTFSGSWGNYSQKLAKSERLEKHFLRYNPSFKPPSAFKQDIPRKSLSGIPSRFAVEMIKDGWILRNDIIWHKTHHSPSSVKDRFTCSHEHLFFFVKDRRYYFDLDSVRKPHRSLRGRSPPASQKSRFHPKGKNPGDVWSITPSQNIKGHHATFPEELCRIPILAGCPSGGIVFDPFAGSGTTCVVAKKLGRRFIGFEMNPDYVALAQERVKALTKSVETSSTLLLSRRHERRETRCEAAAVDDWEGRPLVAREGNCRRWLEGLD
jgi:DNA modification methylase